MLKIENLTYSYDASFGNAVSQVSMDFDKGNIVGILGANGSGKSTLMKLVMGLYKAQEGHIWYDGKPLEHTKKALYQYRQDVCIVFQNSDYQLFYSVVEDDVALALKNLHFPEEVIKERVEEALEAMHIKHLRHKPIQYLSFGQKKKVAIAGVLALKPRYLLLDEPTAGLDPRGRDTMRHLMKKLAAQGTKIILTSHDMDLMYDCCDYAYIIADGQVVSEGSKQEVFLNGTVLCQAGLSVPWIVRLHQCLGLPLAETEEALFKEWRTQNGQVSDDTGDGFRCREKRHCSGSLSDF